MLRTIIALCCTLTVIACASVDPVAEQQARAKRTEEQRSQAAKADADLRRATSQQDKP